MRCLAFNLVLFILHHTVSASNNCTLSSLVNYLVDIIGQDIALANLHLSALLQLILPCLELTCKSGELEILMNCRHSNLEHLMSNVHVICPISS